MCIRDREDLGAIATASFRNSRQTGKRKKPKKLKKARGGGSESVMIDNVCWAEDSQTLAASWDNDINIWNKGRDSHSRCSSMVNFIIQ